MAHTFLTLRRAVASLSLLLLAARTQALDAQPQKPTPAPAAAASPVRMLEIPLGTVLSVELVDEISSGKNKAGETFRTKLQDGVWLQGRVAVPPGATLRGLVTEAVPSGRVKGRAKLALTLATLELEGTSYSVRSDTLTYSGEGHKGKHFGSGIMGALQGALYGVLFGGADGAVIGAGAGAAAGAAGSIIGGKEDINFAQGAKLMFEILSPVKVPEPPSLPASPATTEPKPSKPDEKTGKPAS